MKSFPTDDPIFDTDLRRFLDVRAEELARGIAPASAIAGRISGGLTRSRRREREGLGLALIAAGLLGLACALAVIGARRPNVLASTAETLAATWSPDGSKLAFLALSTESSASGTAVTRGLYLVNADGADMRMLDSEQTSSPWWVPTVSWSPDGTRLVYEVRSDAGLPDASRTDLAVVGIDGTPPLRLTGQGDARLVAWSPKGDRILFERGGTSGSDIFTVAPNGTELLQLTSTGGAGRPIWSPEGSRILYEGGSATWVMAPDGTEQRTLGACCAAGWSADGKAALLDENGSALVVVPLDGHAPETGRLSLGGAWGDRSISPDRSTVAISTAGGIETRGFDGRSGTVTGDGHDAVSGWSPDGAWIAFLGTRPEGTGLFVIPSIGGRPRLVAENASVIGDPWRPGPNPAGAAHLAVAHDGSVLLVSIDGTRIRELVSRVSSVAPGGHMIIDADGPDSDVYSIPLATRLVMTFENRTDETWIVGFPAISLLQNDCAQDGGVGLRLASWLDPAPTVTPALDTPPDACIIAPHTTVSVHQPIFPTGAIHLDVVRQGAAPYQRLGRIYPAIVDFVVASGGS